MRIGLLRLAGMFGARSTHLFTLARTPVYADAGFLILLVFITISSLDEGPIGILSAAVALTLSILIHEFGHVIAAKMNGFRSEVVLTGLGGYTVPDGQSHGWRAIWLSFAGPFFGLIGWAIAWFVFMPEGAKEAGMRTNWTAIWHPVVVYRFTDHAPTGFDMLWIRLVLFGLFLNLFNLLPIFPLDGGHILFRLLRFWKRAYEAERISAIVGIAVGAAAAIYMGQRGNLFGAVILAMLTMQNFQRLKSRGM